MQQIRNKTLNTTIYIDRILGQYTQQTEGPQLLIFTGVHGNEPSGIFAFQKVMHTLKNNDISFKGNMTGIAGNLPALGASVRYEDEDMNRTFLAERVEKIKKGEVELNAEEQQLKELTETVDELTKNADEVFFVDCHSTSSQSEPYISLNVGYPDSYHFVKGIPVNTVVGIEREIKGCLAEYFNKKGSHGFTFEAGQHEAITTIYNQEAVIWLALVNAGCLEEYALPQIAQARETLTNNVTESHRFFNVISSYTILEGETFRMEPGFVNLQHIDKGQLLAHSNGFPVYAPDKGRILMPLYQKQGNNGYFFVQEIDERHLMQDEVTQIH